MKRKETLMIGSSPCSETCVQVGAEDYEVRAREECLRFIDLIRQTSGPEPPGARLFIKRNQHDFGTYLEVAISYDDGEPAAIEYAFRCESESPTSWQG